VTVPEWEFDKPRFTVVYDDSLDSKSEAEEVARKIIAKGLTAGVLEAGKSNLDDADGEWVVWVGRFAKESQADDYFDKLRDKGLEVVSTLGIRQIDEEKDSSSGSSSRTTSTSTDETSTAP
jgi:hypothetical protein